jgi:hypothetical protein
MTPMETEKEKIRIERLFGPAERMTHGQDGNV